jgi:hypothetical protein
VRSQFGKRPSQSFFTSTFTAGSVEKIKTFAASSTAYDNSAKLDAIETELKKWFLKREAQKFSVGKEIQDELLSMMKKLSVKSCDMRDRCTIEEYILPLAAVENFTERPDDCRESARKADLQQALSEADDECRGREDDCTEALPQ